MFSFDDFARLGFLEGYWKGEGADGKEFYEQYDRPEPGMFRSRRFASDAFDVHTEGSRITFHDGEVRSTWGTFSWRASSIGKDYATFEPINAPSRFTWRRVDESTLEAEQCWQAEGKEQQHTIRMTRVTRLV